MLPPSGGHRHYHSGGRAIKHAPIMVGLQQESILGAHFVTGTLGLEPSQVGETCNSAMLKTGMAELARLNRIVPIFPNR